MPEAPSLMESLGAAYDAIQTREAADPTPQPENTPEASDATEAEAVETAEVTEPSADVEPETLEASVEASPEPDPTPSETNDDALEQVLAPRRERFAMDGMTDVQAVQQLFALSDAAEKDPAAFIQWFAQQRGVDLSSLVQQPEPPAEPKADDIELDEFSDPAAKAALEEVRAIKARLEAQEKAQTDAQQQQFVQQVEQFKSAKDEKGALLHPHFEALRPQIAALLNAGVTSLDDAYEQAQWANPVVRAKILESQEAERVKQAQQKAVKAERAGKQTRSSNGQFQSDQKPSMRQTMESVYDRLNAS